MNVLIKSFSKGIILFFISFNLFAQQDTTIVYELEPVEISAKKINLSETISDLSKDKISSVLETNGFSIIRKGAFFASDIYADGLKRSDINVIIDGERYHSACPNRMDSPLTRLNPLEMETVSLSKSSSGLQNGIGGIVEYKRIVPSDPLKYKAGFSGSAGAYKSGDFSFGAQGMNQSVTFRYSTGATFKNADGKSFKDLYGYKDNYNYSLGEASFNGKVNNLRYGASFTYTDNVSFPYLQMDERLNRVYSSFIEFKGHKLYFNYTDHLMDNGLRQSMMSMETKAKNLTVGIVSDFYEIFYRNWDSDNTIKNASMKIDNHLMPNINEISGSISHKFNFERFLLKGKIGINVQSMNDADREQFFTNYFPNAKFTKVFPLFGFSAAYSNVIGTKATWGIEAEIASEAVQSEELFISVKKMMTVPDWSGNPELNQPLKSGLRGIINWSDFTLEGYYQYIWNYVNLAKIALSPKPLQTYRNIDAELLGANLGYKSKYFDGALHFTLGQNTTDNSPLAEIRPLEVNSEIRSPEFFNFTVFGRLSADVKQVRIDKSLGELETPGWYKADIGIKFEHHAFRAVLTVENITNQLYYKHLSYLRNPFSSGFRVFEPGTNVFLSFILNP